MPNWKKVITSGSDAVLNEITSSGGILTSQNIMPDVDNTLSLGSSTQRFQLNGGTPVTVTGSGTENIITRFNGNTEVENSTIENTDTLTTIRHDNDANDIFIVSGSNGELLKVTDEIGDQLLQVNDGSGITHFEVSSSGTLVAQNLEYTDETFVLTYNSSSGNISFFSSSAITGDNLGNHTATQTLDMSSNAIDNVSNITVQGSIIHDGDTNTYLQFAGEDDFRIVAGGIDAVKATSSEIAFNDGQANYDFRVEGDTESHLIFADAANDRVGIGTSTPNEALTLGAGKKISLTPNPESDLTGSVMFLASDNEHILSTFNDSATGDPQQFVIKHNFGDTELINRRGDLIMSASTARVGINTNKPTQALTVEGSISASANLNIDGDITLDNTITFTGETSTIGTNWDGGEGDIRINPEGKLYLGNQSTNDVYIGRQDNASYTTVLYDGGTTQAIKVSTGSVELNTDTTLGGSATLAGTQASTTSDFSILEKFLANPASENGEQADVRLVNNLAGANKWATITLTDCYQSDRTTAITDLGDNPFDGTSAFRQFYQNADGDPMVIQIDLPNQINWSAWVGIVFGNTSWRAKSVKIETFRNGAWQTECDLTNQPSHIVSRKVANNNGDGVTKIKYTLDDIQNTSNHYIRILSLFNFNYRTGAESYGGVHYIEKYKNSEHYSNILPATDSTYDLGSSAKRYANVYTDDITTTDVTASNLQVTNIAEEWPQVHNTAGQVLTEGNLTGYVPWSGINVIDDGEGKGYGNYRVPFSGYIEKILVHPIEAGTSGNMTIQLKKNNSNLGSSVGGTISANAGILTTYTFGDTYSFTKEDGLSIFINRVATERSKAFGFTIVFRYNLTF